MVYELALAPHWYRHRRPSDFCSQDRIRLRWWLSGNPVDGGCRAFETPKIHSTAPSPAHASNYFRAALAARRGNSHGLQDVAAPLSILARRSSPPAQRTVSTYPAVNSGPGLIVFAKTPAPGEVKTRLIPPCSPEQAAGIAARLVRHSIRLATDHWPGSVQLAVWPTVEHPLFEALKREFGVELRRQAEGDLGTKMYEALRIFTDRNEPAAVMGCDVPHCPPAVLKRAYQMLRAGHNFVGPTFDGGYYLIGVSQAHPHLFQDIPWGTGQVIEQTCNNAQQLGITLHKLNKLVDLDTWDDIKQVAQHDPTVRGWLHDFVS